MIVTYLNLFSCVCFFLNSVLLFSFLNLIDIRCMKAYGIYYNLDSSLWFSVLFVSANWIDPAPLGLLMPAL
jgi:hypothetical protein